MRTRRKRPKNAELLELAQIRDRLDELWAVRDAAGDERQKAERAAERLIAREYEDWARGMRESGRGGEIYKGKPVEPRSAERVAAERVLGEAKERERQALRQYQQLADETWERRVEFRNFTAENQRRLVELRGWPTNRYMKGMRESPEDPAHARWSAEDLAACEAERAAAQARSPDPSRPSLTD